MDYAASVDSSFMPYVTFLFDIDFLFSYPDPDIQNKDNWCWAAAAKMAGVHNGNGDALEEGVSRLLETGGVHSWGGVSFCGEDWEGNLYADAGQRHIVMAVHGTDYDLVGTNDHIESALRLASGGICNVGTLESSSSGFSSFDLNRINGDLASGKWVLAVMSMNYENDPFSHVVVITGHQITGTQSRYDFWDPWDGLGYSFYSDTGVVGNVDDYWCSVISWDYAIYCD